MNKHKPKSGPKAYTKRWFNMRRKTIGASEAAAVCGMSRWAQPLTVYQRKIDGEGEQPKTEVQMMGHLLEPSILKGYHMKVKGTMQAPVPMLIHPEIPFMVATPDALWTDSDVPKSKIMEHNYIPVDAKSSRQQSHWGKEGTDDIPQEYIMQAQQQMAVTGAMRCDLPVFLPTMSIKIYRVLRNDPLIHTIVAAEKEMIERIENRDPPEADWTHPGAAELLGQVYDVKQEVSVQLDGFASSLWDEIEELKAQRANIDGDISTRRARILKLMKDASRGELPDGRTLRRKEVRREEGVVPAYSYVRVSCSKPRDGEQSNE